MINMLAESMMVLSACILVWALIVQVIEEWRKR